MEGGVYLNCIFESEGEVEEEGGGREGGRGGGRRRGKRRGKEERKGRGKEEGKKEGEGGGGSDELNLGQLWRKGELGRRALNCILSMQLHLLLYV